MYNSNINLNLYKTFYEVAKYGSISEAAKKTYTSQPAISKAIKKLENDLHVELFYRKINGIELTYKGKELLFYIEKAYNNLVIAERSMIENENLEKGKITIGVPSQIGTFYVFEFISKFHEKYKNIEITIISSGTDLLLKKLESHEIDFIIDSSPINTENTNIYIKPLTKVKNTFVINKGNSYEINNLKDLEKYQLILPIPYTSNRKELNKIFEKYDVKPNNIMNIHTSEMIIGAVKRNLGIGYVIEDLVKDDNTLELIELNEKLPEIEINLVYVKKYLTTAPKKFIQMFIDKEI